jgi:hypothetical protein
LLLLAIVPQGTFTVPFVQCLSVFFPAYAFASVEHQQCIEEAFMPVMNTIMDGMLNGFL